MIYDLLHSISFHFNLPTPLFSTALLGAFAAPFLLSVLGEARLQTGTKMSLRAQETDFEYGYVSLLIPCPFCLACPECLEIDNARHSRTLAPELKHSSFVRDRVHRSLPDCPFTKSLTKLNIGDGSRPHPPTISLPLRNGSADSMVAFRRSSHAVGNMLLGTKIHRVWSRIEENIDLEVPLLVPLCHNVEE